MRSARAQPAHHAHMSEDHPIGMAEMGYAGLSEQWLMRRAGDLHWRLIAQAMGQRQAVFTCAQGQPLYAAFCVSSLRLSDAPAMGDTLTLSGTLGLVGHGRLASIQHIRAATSGPIHPGSEGRPIGRIILISTFVGRTDPASNHGIVRRAPRAMALPAPAPHAAQGVAQTAARILRSHPVLTGPQMALLPCPAVDLNAAGLMYFPSFAALAERADFALGAPHARRIVARDIVYQSNVEPGQIVTVTVDRRPNRTISQMIANDGRPLAIMTSRHITHPPRNFPTP